MKRCGCAFWLTVALVGGVRGFHAVTGAEAPAMPGARVLTRVADIRSLNREEAGLELGVRITGTVTFADLDSAVLYIQDDTGGVFVAPREPVTVLPATRVEVNGVTRAGSHLPFVAKAVVIDRGATVFPRARVVDFDRLATGEEDSNWVETQGVVRSAQVGRSQLRLVLAARGRRIVVRVSEPGDLPMSAAELVDAEVRVKGVAGALSEGVEAGVLLDLHVPHPRFLEVVVPGTPPLELPLLTTAALRAFVPTNDLVHRVRVRGALESEPGLPVRLRDETGSIDLSTATLELRSLTNDSLDVAGFPATGPDGPRMESPAVLLLRPERRPETSEVGAPPLAEYRPVLTAIDQVRRLSTNQAASRYLVRVRGVITFGHRFADDSVGLFVQDETAGIFVADEAFDNGAFPKGSAVELEGVSDPGAYAPIIVKTRMALLGEGRLPAARRATIDELLLGHRDSQRVSVQGVVTGVRRFDPGTYQVSLLAGSKLLRMIVVGEPAGLAPERYIDALVRVDGVCDTTSNLKRQLVDVGFNVPDWGDIRVLTSAPTNPFALEPRTIRSVSQFDPDPEARHRVLLQGTVTFHVPGQGVFLQDDHDGLFVAGAFEDSLEPGDQVDVIGFPQAGRPDVGLLEPQIRRRGRAPDLLASSVTMEQLGTGEHDNRLVAVQASLIEVRQGTNQTVIVCQSEDRIFEAQGQSSWMRRLVAPGSVGSVLRLTGVWAVQVDPVAHTEVSRLWLRGPADMEVLESPPWSTGAVAKAVGLALLGFALAALGWGALLRRQVAERTAETQKALALLEVAIAQSPSGILIADPPDVRIRWYNPAALAMRGPNLRPLAEPKAEDPAARWQMLKPDGSPYAAAQLPLSRAVLKGETTRNEELIIRDPEGGERWVLANAAPIHEPGGRIIAGIVILQDITEVKRAGAALEESERRYRLLHEAMRDAFARVDMSGRLVDFNQAFETMLGYRAEELMGKTYRDLTPERWHEAEARIIEQEVMQLGVSSVYQKEYRAKDGRVFPVELRAYLIRDGGGKAIGMWALVRDITERKRHEQVQQAIVHLSEAALSARTLEDLFPFIHQVVGEVMPAPNFYVALGDPAGDVIRFPYYADERDAPVVMRKAGPGLTEHVLQTGKPVLVTGAEIRAWREQGTIHSVGTTPVSWLGVPLRTQDRTIGVMVVQSYVDNVRYGDAELAILVLMSYPVANAIERKRVEQELRESQDKFSRAFHLSPDSINLNRLEDGVYLEVNEGFTEVTGYTREEVLGRSARSGDMSIWADPKDHEQLVAGLRSRGEVTGLEARFRCKDGRVKIGLMSARLLSIQGENCILSITRDITERTRAEEERKRLQAQLLQAQKMESVGRLAGGVAHDFNNMLQAILGNAALAVDEEPASSRVREHLSEIQTAAQRSAELTRQLLAFARKQTVHPRVLDLNDTVSGMLNMLRRLLGEDIQLAWLPGAGLWSVRMDPSQLDQILANLVVNARDAVSGGGRISIQTCNVTVDAARARELTDAAAGDFVQLSVTDNGCGMSPEIQAHLFEPFFTTKAAGKGTGLGLATVYGIVKQNQGFIGLQSEPGRGSTFQIHLPRAAAEVRPPPDTAERRSWRGSETILLVEDEEQVLRLSRRILEQHGYTVLAARLPAEAIRMAQECPGPIHLLLTDVVMPGMNGRELSQRLLALRPDLKCLFMSGYTADVVAREGVVDEGVQLLQKPFTVEGLTQSVREILGRA